MTVKQVAARAGVSWSTVFRVQAGHPGVSAETMCAVAEAVGLDLVLQAYPGRQPSLRDSGQLVIANRLLSQAHAAWQPTMELAIGEQGRAIDIVLSGPGEILACEIERLVVDFQAQYRRADAKRRALAAMHQRPVRLVIVVEDTRRNRRAVQGHPAIQAALPAGSRDVFGSLRSGRALGRDGLLWLRRGRGESGGDKS
jgi:hypothetical protein